MDDHQARDVAALVKAGRNFPFIEKHGYSSYSQLVEALTDALAALPVAPEQPTRASLQSRLAHAEAVISKARYEAREEFPKKSRCETLDAYHLHTPPLEPALVSSPSVETITPDRETIIREVLDWIAARQVQPQQSRVVARAAREHFGVSS